jgi:predicted MFS family arabinose efflux permease
MLNSASDTPGTALDTLPREWPLLASLFALGALINSTLLCAPALATQLGVEFKFSAQYVGYFFSIEFLGYALSGLIATYAVVRLDWRKIALFGLAIFIVGNISSSFLSGNIESLFIARGITATAGCLVNVICLSSAGRTANPSRTYGIFVVGQLLFGVVGLAILPTLFQHDGIAAYYRIVALLAIVALIFAVPFLPTSSGTSRDDLSASDSRKSSLRTLVLGVAWGLFFYMSLSGVWTFVGSIGQAIGLNSGQAGEILSIATVAGIVGSLSAAVIGSGRASRPMIAFGFGCMALSIIAFMVPRSTTAYFLAAVAFKFAWTFVLPFVFAVIAEADRTGRLFSLVSASIGVGLAIGPAVAGYFVSHSSGFDPMLSISGVICVASWASIWILSRRLSKIGSLSRTNATNW